MKDIDVSICLVNHNAKDLTLNCIKSIYQKTDRPQFEIIVVDNASTDNSAAAIKKLYPGGQCVISSPSLLV